MHFFDVTDIVLYVEKETSVSGIQRVSFEVIKRMVDRHGTEAVRLSYWDRGARSYVSIPSDFIAEMQEFDPDTLSTVFFGKAARSKADTAPTLERYRNKPMKYRFHHLRSTMHAARGNAAHFEKHNTSIAEWHAFNKGEAAELNTPDAKLLDIPRTRVADIAQKGDPLVVLGATWAIDGLDACFQGLADDQGMQISQLIHDLIPIITPEHIAGDFAQEFYRWLKTSMGYCAGYYANSRNTARDLAAFMAEIGVERPIQTIPLAQEFTHVAPNIRKTKGPDGPFKARVDRTLGLRREILNLSKVPFVLVVGTMESRKNIWRLAQAWQRMSVEPGIDLPKLVFAGKPGWYNDDFNALMEATGNLGGWVQFAERPTDAELAYLYETCAFTAMVSFYEGWGLPIGEGLHFGKTGLVADNSSMPEVGGDMVAYCDAHSLNSIHAAARKLVSDSAYRAGLEAKINAAHLRTWDDVTRDFVDVLSK